MSWMLTIAVIAGMYKAAEIENMQPLFWAGLALVLTVGGRFMLQDGLLARWIVPGIALVLCYAAMTAYKLWRERNEPRSPR